MSPYHSENIGLEREHSTLVPSDYFTQFKKTKAYLWRLTSYWLASYRARISAHPNLQRIFKSRGPSQSYQVTQTQWSRKAWKLIHGTAQLISTASQGSPSQKLKAQAALLIQSQKLISTSAQEVKSSSQRAQLNKARSRKLTSRATQQKGESQKAPLGGQTDKDWSWRNVIHDPYTRPTGRRWMKSI